MKQSTPKHRISSWRVLLCVCMMLSMATIGASLQGCPGTTPDPENNNPANDTKTVWEGTTTVPDSGPDQLNEDLEPPPQVSFVPTTLNKSLPLETIAFFGDSGAAVGKGLFHSDNQGATWKDVSPAPWVGTIYDLALHPSDKTMLAVGGSTVSPRNGLLLLSIDAGASWKVAHILKSSGKDLRFRTALWLTNLIALVAGEGGLLYRTRDGGETWEPLDSLPDKAKLVNFRDMILVDDTIMLVGSQGTILESKTNGTSWTIRRQKADDPSILSIHFIDDSTGIAVGEKGLALFSSTSGRAWEELTGLDIFPDDDNLHTVTSNGSTSFVIIAKRNFWISKNRGRFWRNNGIFLSELPLKHSLTGAFFTAIDTAFFTSTYGVVLKGTFN